MRQRAGFRQDALPGPSVRVPARAPGRCWLIDIVPGVRVSLVDAAHSFGMGQVPQLQTLARLCAPGLQLCTQGTIHEEDTAGMEMME